MNPIVRLDARIVNVCPFDGYTIVLPRQNPLEIFRGLQSQAMDEWSATFLCMQCGRTYDYLRREVGRRDISMPDHMYNLAALADLWRIDYGCAHENCKNKNVMYTSFVPNSPESDVLERVLQTDAKLICSAGHTSSPSNAALTLTKCRQ